MVEEKFSPEQSLQLIRSMIEKVKQDFSDNSFFLLLWGWLILIAALLHYGLMTFSNFKQPWMAWSLMWVGAVISIYYAIRSERKQKHKTYIRDTMKLVGAATGITFSVLAFILGYFELWFYSFPVYFTLYGYIAFVSGTIISFAPLRWAGVACWPVAVVSVFVSFDIQLLLMAFVVLISYIIPGYLLKFHQKNQTNRV